MSGFYERPPSGNRQYHCVTDRDVGGLVVAGLYEPWGENNLSCTMITKPSSAPLSGVHGRTPVLLTPESAKQWLSVEPSVSKEFLMDCDIDSLIMWPIDNRVGKARNVKSIIDKIKKGLV